MSKGFIVAVKEETDSIEEINGCPVYYCGVGKVNAAIGANELIKRGITEIINIGSCGSKKHKLGDIIKVGKVFQDIDCSPICEYGLTAFDTPEAFLLLDENSSHTCFSTDYFYDHTQISKYSPHYLNMINNSSIFDMELFAIAKTCQRNQVKTIAYKWVSDDGDFSKWMENCRISSKKVIEMLTNS